MNPYCEHYYDANEILRESNSGIATDKREAARLANWSKPELSCDLTTLVDSLPVKRG